MKKVFFKAAAGRFFGAMMVLLTLGVLSAKADAIAFFYALDADFQTLKAAAQPVGQPLKVGSRSIAVLQIASHRVYAVKMGSGAVETAASTQALLARVRCDMAFSVGPVGAISDTIKTGAWYRVSEAVSYQKGSWTKAGFQSSPAAALKLDGSNGPTFTNLPALFTNVPPLKIASGEIFVASDSYRTQLHETTGADAVDMNLFGLLTVCADQQVPVHCWRIASDRADDNASEDFKKFVAACDGAGGKAVAELIKTLPANPNSPESYPNLKRLLTQ